MSLVKNKYKMEYSKMKGTQYKH